ncbi:MAG TPA: cupin domain-containing protein, partial [Candidatus Eisenbacteria bacterium]|nr:cupin domain-containing protein [Candidatus Eisenbacteria bacterium]
AHARAAPRPAARHPPAAAHADRPLVTTPELTPEYLIETLGLVPLPFEGGWYVETWRSSVLVPTERGRRAAGSAIWYLITPDSFSALHRVAFDELFHLYLGDAVEMLQLLPGGSTRTLRIGADIAGGERPQALVPAGVWQGARLLPGGSFALFGVTMAPGFDRADFEPGDRAALIAHWPHAADHIRALTR